MRIVLGTILAFIIGFAAVYTVVVIGGHWFTQQPVYFATDGSRQIMFHVAPLCALVSAILAALVAQHVLSRNRLRSAGAVPADHPLAQQSARDADSSVTSSYASDPAKVLWIVGAFVCALSIVIFIWDIQPNSLGYWRLDNAAIWTAFFFAPLITLLWAAVAGAQPWRTRTYIWLRRAIQLHAVLALATTLGGCSGLLPAPWHVYGLLGFGAIFVDLIVLALSPWLPANADDIRIYRKAQLALSGTTVAAIVLWSFVNIGLVVVQAHSIAAGRPYCLQVAGDAVGRYKPVRSLMELNGLKMHTPFTNTGGSSDFQNAFHAVLVVEDESYIDWRNWSYRHMSFIPRDIRPRSTKARPTCQPRLNFAAGLSVW